MSKKAASIMAVPVSEREQLLSTRQKDIMNFIREYIFSKGYPPSVREIGSAVGLSSSASVHANLKKLAEFELLQRDLSKPRAIELTQENSWRQKSVVPVPLVGKVAAGIPILANENIEEIYPIPHDLLGTSEDVFMLLVTGDSMINAGIFDGDYIVAKKQNYASNGDIVVALINNEETTVKKFYRELRSVRLEPANEKYKPIIGTTEISILGKVIAVFRIL